MYYVYLLKSKRNGEYYIGSTDNLKRRFYQHNKGLNKSTKRYLPWQLVYYEAFPAKVLAEKREQKLKRYGKGLVELKKRLGLR